MFPVLFEIGGVSVSSYAALISLGYVCALFLVRRLARLRGLSAASFTDLAFFSLLFGIIGARLFFVLTNLDYFRAYPREIFAFWSGGLVFYGGFLFVLPGLFLFFRARRLPWRVALDVMAPALALGHAIGRLGCLAAGCCHGSYCELPWAIQLHSPLVDPSLRGLPIHPVQVYESIGLIALCGLLLWIFHRKRAEGAVALAYLMGYSLLRFVMEFFRGDQIRGSILGISTSQAVSVLLLLAGAAILIGGHRRFGRDLR